MSGAKNFRISLSSLIILYVASAAVILTAALVLNVMRESHVAAMQSADTHFREISGKTIAEINVVIASITSLTDVASLSFADGPGRMSAESLLDGLRKMIFILDANVQVMSVYVGYADGQFHQVIAPRGNSHVLKTYDAPEGTAYIDRVIRLADDGVRRQSWRFLTPDLGVIAVRMDDEAAYDPRQRPWYLDARKAGRSVYTAPYVFSSSRMPGITCARVLEDGHGVFGVDVSLSRLGELLAGQRVTPQGRLWIVDADNRLVAMPGQTWERLAGDSLQLPLAGEMADPVVRAATLAAASGDGGSGEPRVTDIVGVPYLTVMTPMADENGLHLRVVAAAPLSDVTGHIDDMALRIVFLAAVLLCLAVPLVMVLSRRAVRPVRLLCEEAEKIRRFDFSPSVAITSHVAEVQALADACEVMKATIRDKTRSLLDTQAKLEMLVSGGLALAAEKDMAKLVTLIFQSARTLAKADGGVLYRVEGEELGVELVSLKDASLVLGGLSDKPAPRVKVRPAILPFLSPASVLRPACEALLSRRTVSLREGELSLFPTGLPEEPTTYRITSHLTIPLVTRRDQVLGVLQLFNPDWSEVDAADAAGPDGQDRQGGFLGSLTAQASVALDNHQLVNSLRELFDALIQVIASSIDAKSPYTAGHCTRVPVLTEMLARAVHETTDGPLADFRMETADDWRQLWIASWLHDCGKVTTPEYVVDKATKLETIYNRIHEIRTRFEVLRRDAEIRLLRESCREGDVSPQRRQDFAQEVRGLEDDFAFVAACNLGGEFLSEADRRRLSSIAGRTWLRHFSDRIGISAEERRGKQAVPEPSLPAVEPLLGDRPEHVVPRIKIYPDLRDIHGNLLSIPQNEYDRGELYNLCIARGTLTPEERFKINEHTISGLEMLRKIPFPEELGRVTEIATGHHETLVGTGYPLKKCKEQLPVEARIMAVADIFEALTAADRPYKKAKTLSEALRIMSFMRNDRHIDPDIFDIFLISGVFSAYAETHLVAFQRDVTDIGPYLSQPDACNKT